MSIRLIIKEQDKISAFSLCARANERAADNCQTQLWPPWHFRALAFEYRTLGLLEFDSFTDLFVENFMYKIKLYRYSIIWRYHGAVR